MSILQAVRGSREQLTSSSMKRPELRLLVLCVLLLLSVVLYLILGTLSIPRDEFIMPFLFLWIVCFLPYLGACALVLLTSAPEGRWRQVEVGIIFVGALLFRAILLPRVPSLSRDSWRYVWDARVILHGYSPYVYPPDSNVLKPLRDALIYGNSGFLEVPTIYPPGAQAVYVLSYLLAPSNLFVLKAIFVCCDMITCAGLALLLQRRGLDLRRVVIYAWCPLPIVEYAIEGHVDALTLMLVVLVLLAATSARRDTTGMRILIGFLIALATLTKIYPLVLLAVVMRRRDWALLVTCFATIIGAYIPFLILGHGQVLGFFSTYASEQRQNAGVVPQVVHWFTYSLLRLKDSITVLVQYCVDLLLVVPLVIVVFVQRLLQRISMEMATLVLFGMVFAVSTHIFPWYTPVLLLWVPLLIRPLWSNRGLSGKGVAIAAVWYFVCTSLFGYFFRNTLDWNLYYIFVYDVVVVALGLAAVGGIMQMRRMAVLIEKKTTDARVK